ncbi:MAG: DUF481 domain-containing protein [Elusimicrobia bacterium]|nr:DUF481 domain-containing protein [Elusimicrobiota bacterium]
MKSALLLCALTALIHQTAWAQFPSLRATDTRTSTPEAVMQDRKDWGLDLAFGGNFNRGNTDVDYISGGFSAFKAWSDSSAYLNGSMIYNTFGSRKILNQGSLTARYDREIQRPWKIFAFNTNAYNEFIRLDYRSTTGVGPWYDAQWGEVKHGLSLAITHEYENFKGGLAESAARLSLRDVLRLPLSQAAELRADFFYRPKMDAIGDYHLFAEIGLETIIWKRNLGLKLAWIDEYDSRPQPGVKPNDALWLSAVTLHFGE